jgi:hypothetical protein
MPEWVSDLSKQGISSLFTAAFPYVTNGKVFKLTFLNPQVAADLWLPAAFLTFVGTFLSYGLALPNKAPTGAPAGMPPPPSSKLSVAFAFGSFLFALFGLLAAVFLTQGLIAIDPGWESFLVRVAYVLFFVGLGPALGWALGRVIG